MNPPSLHIVKSAHDIGSAVAHRLHRAGRAALLLEDPAPGATRRLMCFAGAVHEGRAELQGVAAVRCHTVEEARDVLQGGEAIPLLTGDLAAPLAVSLPQPIPQQIPLPAHVLVDARMRKRAVPPVQIGEASLTLGIGPGFHAGKQVHVVIESNWGDNLGRVIREGSSEAYTGKHRLVEGLGAQRYLYAPSAGVFQQTLELLAPVQAGQEVGRVDGRPLLSEAKGILRGIAWTGLRVEAGAKLAEIDPTGDPANCQGISERPARIAEGVLEAIEGWEETKK